MNDLNSITSSPRRIRQSNDIAALLALYRFGRMSRAELARKMGLNRSSSGQITAELTESGLVREVKRNKKSPEPGHSRVGRPGILLELVPDAAVFLGAEIGVEHITTVQLDLVTNILHSTVKPFDGPSVGVEEAIAMAVKQAFTDLPDELVDRCEGFGLSAPAQMNTAGHISVAPLLGWQDVNFAELARAEVPVDVPVMVENDANAFAIGEGYKSDGGQSGVTLFLVLESGVGGGIVIDGVLFRGGHGLAGEIGHMLVQGESGEELEQVIGLDRLLTNFRHASGHKEADLENFLAFVDQRAPKAVAVADDWARHLGFALMQACRLIDPDRIVLGGSVARLYPLVEARVLSYMRASQASTFPIPEIIVDKYATSGPAFGAACMCHQRFLSLDNELFGSKMSNSSVKTQCNDQGGTPSSGAAS